MNRQIVFAFAAVVLSFVLGGCIGDEFRQKPDRPVLRVLARAARWGLWIMVAGEAEPKAEPQYTRSSPDRIDHARSL